MLIARAEHEKPETVLRSIVVGRIEHAECNVVPEMAHVEDEPALAHRRAGSLVGIEGRRAAVAVGPVGVVPFQAPVLPGAMGDRPVPERDSRQVGEPRWPGTHETH